MYYSSPITNIIIISTAKLIIIMIHSLSPLNNDNDTDTDNDEIATNNHHGHHGRHHRRRVVPGLLFARNLVLDLLWI